MDTAKEIQLCTLLSLSMITSTRAKTDVLNLWLHALVDLSPKTDVRNLRSRVLVDLSAQNHVLNMHLLTFVHYLYSKVIKCTNHYNLVILFYTFPHKGVPQMSASF